MSTADDEYEQPIDDVMAAERGISMSIDSKFLEEIVNGQIDHECGKKQRSKTRKAAPRFLTRQFYADEDMFNASGEEDHFLSNDEEYFFAQLGMIKEPSVQCMGTLRNEIDLEAISSPRSKGKSTMLIEQEPDHEYSCPFKMNEMEELDNPHRMEIIKEEFPKLLSVLLDFKEAVKSEGKIKLLPLTDSYRSKKLKMSGGIMDLEITFELLLSCCMNYGFYAVFKLQEDASQKSRVIQRLVYIRSLLTKLIPRDKNLEYRINKLFRMAGQSETGADNFIHLEDMPGSFLPLKMANNKKPFKKNVIESERLRQYRDSPRKPVTVPRRRKLYHCELAANLENENKLFRNLIKQEENKCWNPKANCKNIPKLGKGQNKFALADQMGSFERRNDFEMEVEGEDNEKGIQVLQDFMMVSEYQENRKSLRYLEEEMGDELGLRQLKKIKKLNSY